MYYTTGQYSESDLFSHQKCNVKFKQFSGAMLPNLYTEERRCPSQAYLNPSVWNPATSPPAALSTFVQPRRWFLCWQPSWNCNNIAVKPGNHAYILDGKPRFWRSFVISANGMAWILTISLTALPSCLSVWFYNAGGTLHCLAFQKIM